MRKIWVLALMVGAAACGSEDDGPAAMPGMVNAAQAKNSVTAAVGLRSATEAMMGPTVASSAMAFNASTTNIVTAKTGARVLTAALLGGLETVAQTSGTQMCTASKCTFDKFVSGATTLDGTVEFTPSGEGKAIKWNLTMKGTGPSVGLNYDYNGKGDITISATSLSGAVTTVASGSSAAGGQTVTFNSESFVRFDQVVLTGGNPTAGSLYAKSTSSGSSGGQTGATAYEGTHKFGP